MESFFTQKILQLLAAGDTIVRPTKSDLNLPSVDAGDDVAKRIFTIVFGLTAAIAVLVIVISALNMAKSDGNPDEISKAKKGIIFSLVGLLIVLSAESIVYFVMGRL